MALGLHNPLRNFPVTEHVSLQEQHLEARWEDGQLASLIRCEKIRSTGVKSAIAENLRISTHATDCAVRLCSNDLELHAIMGECLPLLEGIGEVAGEKKA